MKNHRATKQRGRITGFEKLIDRLLRKYAGRNYESPFGGKDATTYFRKLRDACSKEKTF